MDTLIFPIKNKKIYTLTIRSNDKSEIKLQTTLNKSKLINALKDRIIE